MILFLKTADRTKMNAQSYHPGKTTSKGF